MQVKQNSDPHLPPPSQHVFFPLRGVMRRSMRGLVGVRKTSALRFRRRFPPRDDAKSWGIVPPEPPSRRSSSSSSSVRPTSLWSSDRSERIDRREDGGLDKWRVECLGVRGRAGED